MRRFLKINSAVFLLINPSYRMRPSRQKIIRENANKSGCITLIAFKHRAKKISFSLV